MAGTLEDNEARLYRGIFLVSNTTKRAPGHAESLRLVLASPAMRWPPPLLVTQALVLAVTGIACSTGSSPPQDPADGSTSAQPATATADATATTEPTTVTSAIGPTGDITNTPPSNGVVMDNATPPGSSSVATRLQPIIDLIVANREKYRTCFDVWGKSNPGRELRVTFSIKLDKEGTLESSAFKPDETDVVDKPMETCMQNVSQSLKFPASPNGQETRYNHRFVFKAKKS
jgi:hypothetical protein